MRWIRQTFNDFVRNDLEKKSKGIQELTTQFFMVLMKF